ncbi:MAG: M17 family peptidase N-terminal domain-containing protein, partial [Pseudomonadota bacterium]
MPKPLSVSFDTLNTKLNDCAVVLIDQDGKLPSRAKKLDKASDGHLTRVLEAAGFEGKAKSSVDV